MLTTITILLGDNMRTNDKKSNFLKIIFIIIFFVIILLSLIIFYNYYFGKSYVYATQTNGEQILDVKISNANFTNIEDIIETNINKNTKYEFIQEETILEYITKYKNNSDLPKGTSHVLQEGRGGIQKITKKRTYQNNEMINEEVVDTKVTKASINKIVEIGTGKYENTYKAKIGDMIYVTSDRLSVMSEPNEDSLKITTLQRNDELKLLQIKSDWYKISYKNVIGFVKSECTMHINNEMKEENFNQNTSIESKDKLISPLSFNMALNKPSGLTLDQFKKVLSDSKDINKIFTNNAEYFYYIEKEYNINGIFVASVGIHESGWGTSKIAQDKNNLFGYGAYDSNPYNGAYSFSNYSESIDLISRVFVKYYLNPKGTSIYEAEKALGTYYNGNSLSAVNEKYATDKNWANSVYNHMKYLYSKL